MKKIKKIDSRASQSVFSFACPCIGNCYSTCLACGCGSESLMQVAYNAARSSLSLLGQYGTQVANYT